MKQDSNAIDSSAVLSQQRSRHRRSVTYRYDKSRWAPRNTYIREQPLELIHRSRSETHSLARNLLQSRDYQSNHSVMESGSSTDDRLYST